MDRIIINEQCSVLRSIARNELKNNWVVVTLSVFLYYIMSTVIPQFFNTFIRLGSVDQYNTVLHQNITISLIAYFYLIFFTGVFEVGVCSFFIAFFRNKDANPGYIFNGFEYYLKCFALAFMVGLFTLLWTLLFIVPGIIAAFRYSQAFYILADDPNKGILQCINESKFMMNGNKAKLFLLDLSFIGWFLLATVPMAIFSLKSVIPSSALSFALSSAAAVTYCIALAYMMTAKTAFYDILTGHLRAKPAFNEADYHFGSNTTNEDNKENTGSQD